jgi:hypothetical protein
LLVNYNTSTNSIVTCSLPLVYSSICNGFHASLQLAGFSLLGYDAISMVNVAEARIVEACCIHPQSKQPLRTPSPVLSTLNSVYCLLHSFIHGILRNI